MGGKSTLGTLSQDHSIIQFIVCVMYTVYVEFSSGENFLSCVNDCTEDIMVSLTALAKIFSMDFSAIQR